MSRSPASWNCWIFSGARRPRVASTALSAVSSSGGWPSSGPSSPSSRRIGGWPTLRWTSLAPSSTARVSRPFRSMRTRTRDRPRAARALAQGGLEVVPGVAGALRDGVDERDRALLEPTGRARVAELSLEQLLDDPEGQREAGKRERRARKAVEGHLRAPAGGRERRDPARHRLLVRLEPRRVAGQHVEGSVGHEPGGEEGLVHAVARERVDEPGRVADHGGGAARETARRPAHRQAVAARTGRRVGIDVVFLAKPAQMLAEARALALVAADADVDVVALRKDPAVATGDDRKPEHHRPGVARLVREVRFARDAVHDLAAEPELAGRDAVARGA